LNLFVCICVCQPYPALRLRLRRRDLFQLRFLPSLLLFEPLLLVEQVRASLHHLSLHRRQLILKLGLALFTLFSPELGLWVGTFRVILQ
jgi:hypothetical protein